MHLTSDIVKELNARLLKSLTLEYPVGLFWGKSGIAVYLYELYGYTLDESYKHCADTILRSVIESGLTSDIGLSVSKGLTGIGLCIDYLVTKGYIEGDVNLLLSDIDSQLFKEINYNVDSHFTDVQTIQILFYLYKRLQKKSSGNDIFIYSQAAYDLLNDLASNLKADFFREPYSSDIADYGVPILLKILSLYYLYPKFAPYRNRILKLLELCSDNLFSHLPKRIFHRLFLYWGVVALRDLTPDWNAYVNLLKDNINIEHLVSDELKSHEIFLNNGLALIVFILSDLNKHFHDGSFEYDEECLYTKMEESEVWGSLKDTWYFMSHRGLINGYPGAILSLCATSKHK